MRRFSVDAKARVDRGLSPSLSPLPLSSRKPLGGAPPGGERAFWRGGAQVRLTGTVYPEPFPDFRRGGTLGRPRFPGLTHVLAAL